MACPRGVPLCSLMIVCWRALGDVDVDMELFDRFRLPLLAVGSLCALEFLDV